MCSVIFLSSSFITHAPSFILGKVSFEKNAIKSRLVIEIISNIDIT